jgi:hypothetical protein
VVSFPAENLEKMWDYLAQVVHALAVVWSSLSFPMSHKPAMFFYLASGAHNAAWKRTELHSTRPWCGDRGSELIWREGQHGSQN